MAQTGPGMGRVDRTPTNDTALAETASAAQLSSRVALSEAEKDKAPPLPSWLVKFYFIFVRPVYSKLG